MLGLAQDWQWVRHAGGPLNEYGWLGAVGPAGESYTFGSYGNFDGPSGSGVNFGDVQLQGSKNGFLAKYDAEGTLLWAMALLNPQGNAAASAMVLDTVTQAIYLLFNYSGTCTLDTCTVMSGGSTAGLSKWTLDGRCLWARNIASGPYIEPLFTLSGLALTMTSTGTLAVSFVADWPSSNTVGNVPVTRGPVLAMFDAEGEVLWVKQVASTPHPERITFTTLRHANGRIYAHGKTVLTTGNPLVVDTIQLPLAEGQGMALACFDPANGMAEWFRLDGFPNAHATSKQGMDISANGRIHCTGMFGGTTYFGDDTLTGTAPGARGYLATYDLNGNSIFSRALTGTGFFAPIALMAMPSNELLLTGAFTGQFDAAMASYTASTEQDMFILRCALDGVPQALAHAGMGQGNSVAHHEGVILVGGIFPQDYPSVPATNTITFGSEVLTTYGGSDIFLAKLGMITSVPPPKNADEDRLLIYANPNQGSFRMVLPEALQQARGLVLRIYDGQGRLVSEQNLRMDEERPRVDIWDTGPGFYMVTVSDGRRTYSGSMMVE